MTKLWVLFGLCFSLLSAQPQDIFMERWQFADFQFENGNYEVAVVEYNRLLFFSTEVEEKAMLNFNIGWCYYYLEAWNLSANYFDYAYETATSDSLQMEAVFGKVRTLMRTGDWSLALIELASFSAESDYQNKIALYEGVCQFKLGNFSRSKTLFLSMIAEGDTASRQQIEWFFNEKKYLMKPNPNRAMMLSFMFPGTGQLYAGDLKNGFNSLALNGLLIGLGVNIALNLTILDAMVSVAPWIQRYYVGGGKGAHRIAGEARDQRREQTFQEIIQVLEEAQSPH
jgi:tetratricopeptide (TPR) repeat protein